MTNRTTTQGSARRTAAIGVTAGLLGGGAIGLMLTVPSLTSAASEDTGVAPVVALQDTNDDGTTTGDAIDPERPEPGELMREVLQDLVDDGTLTAAQADAVAEHLADHWAEHRDERRDRRMDRREDRRERRADRGATIAEAIGIDAETLRDELRAGSSVADVAEANGVDVEVVVQALVDDVAAHLDEAVEAGRLTEDEAAERLEQAAERITERIDQVPGEGR